MKVFISSVRSGLEEERDALPGLIAALGHTPARFEDFSAQKVPSREACLAAVADSDVYLLLLGPHYGHKFPETGQSATHDEWRAAQQAGVQIYVFRKTGVPFDEDQEVFAREVGEYGSGRFWKTFDSTAQLQQVAVEAIQDAQNQPSALDFEPLVSRTRPTWSVDGLLPNRSPLLEIHLLPVDAEPISDRVFGQASQRLPGVLRAEGVVSQFSGLEPREAADVVLVHVVESAQRLGWHDVRPSRFEAAFLHKLGEMGAAYALAADQMGSFLDRDDTVQNVAQALQLFHRMEYTSTSRCAIALRVTQAQRVTVGSIPGQGRSSMTSGSRADDIEIVPDESIPTAALGTSAHEIAASNVDALLRAMR